MDVSLAVASDSDRPIDRGPAAPLAWRARRAGTPTTSRPVVGTETMVIGAAGFPRRAGKVRVNLSRRRHLSNAIQCSV